MNIRFRNASMPISLDNGLLGVDGSSVWQKLFDIRDGLDPVSGSEARHHGGHLTQVQTSGLRLALVDHSTNNRG